MMTRLRDLLATHERALARLELGLAIATPLLFLVLAVMKAVPFVDDTPLIVSPTGELLPGGGDDWFSYKIHALGIVRKGPFDPSFGQYVFTVHGFLYNYFIAGIFKVFGENTSFVYVIQTFLVGASVTVLYLFIRGRVSHVAAIAFILIAAFQLYTDYFRSLSFLLMSENLFVFMFSVLFVTCAWAYRRRTISAAFIAGIVLGLTVLSRTSAVTAALGVIVVWLLYAIFERRSVTLATTGALAVGFVLAMGLLPLREFLVTGEPDILLLTAKHGLDVPPDELSQWPGYYTARALFTIGIPQPLMFYDPGIFAYRFKPYWLLIWLGVFGYMFSRIFWRRMPDVRDFAPLVFLGMYIAAYTFVSTHQNYGGRSVSVGLPLAAVFAALFLSDLIGKVTASRGQRLTTTAG